MGSLRDRYAESFRSGDKDGMYRALLDIDERFEVLRNKVGSREFVDDPLNPVTVTTPPPPPADFSAVGLDGKFLVIVNNPQNINPQNVTLMQLRVQQSGANSSNAAIIHQLQSATDTLFNQNSNLKDYGTSSQLSWVDQDPNVTRFFRLRSSFDGQTWNNWQIFSSDQTCGPIGVWSGLLRTAALSYVNSAATTTDGSNPLTQSGTSTAINVASKVWNVGTQQITYSGGSVDPGSFGRYYIYGIDTLKQGGAITYLATQNIGDLTAQDGIIIFGNITTAGGGGGTGGGGGSCHVAGTLIAMFDGTTKDCSLIRKGDEILGTDGGKEIAQADAEGVPNVPCFTLALDAAGLLQTKTFIGNCTVWRQRLDRTKTFWADSTIGVSSSEPVMLANGPFMNVFDAMIGQQFRTTTINGSLFLASHNLKP